MVAPVVVNPDTASKNALVTDGMALLIIKGNALAASINPQPMETIRYPSLL